MVLTRLRGSFRRAGASLRLGSVALLAAGVLLATATTAAAASLPSNHTPPTIAEIPVPREGRTVHARSGSWLGSRPLTYSYVWLRCNNSGAGCVEVAATAK